MDRDHNIRNLLNQGFRVFSFIGEAGCGKSELALSIALRIHELTDRKVHVFDMDQTKPILRLRNVIQETDRQSLVLHTGLNFLDIPRVPLGIETLISDKDSFVVFDLGGNLTGAINLGQYAELLNREDAITFMVINYFRPFSDDWNNLQKNLQKYSAVIGKEITRIISNPNFGMDTTGKDIVYGNGKLEDLLQENGYSVDFVAVDCKNRQEELEPVREKLIYLSPRIHFDLERMRIDEKNIDFE